MKKTNKKVVLITIALILVTIIIATVIIIINQNNNKREQEYDNLIKSIAIDIYEHEIIAELHSSYITSIWYNAIFKKHDTYTDKYVFPVDEYGYGVNTWVSFQTAINNYKSANRESLNELQNIKNELGIRLNNLQNIPNDKYKKQIDLLTEMYSKFSTLISLANTPTGTYKEYGEKCNKYKEEFRTEYEKLLILVPNIRTDTTNFKNVL